MKVALLLSHCSSQGVRSLAGRLHEALRLDGHKVRVEALPCLPGKGVLVEARILRRLASWTPDAVISLNNYCRLLCMTSPRRAYFLHGYVPSETLQSLTRGPGSARYQGSLVLASSLLSRLSPAKPICHSLTACEANGIEPGEAIILPQFLLPRELSVPRLEKRYDVLAYTSSVATPRIMRREAILELLRYVAVRRPGSRLILVDPATRRARIDRVGDSLLVVYPALPPRLFLTLLSSTKIYLERSLDEELGTTSLEAIARGAAVAKITAPGLQDRQDYERGEILVASGLRELAEDIVDALSRGTWMDHASRGRKWLVEKRLWDKVKEAFYRGLSPL